jgi:hypothetical protein
MKKTRFHLEDDIQAVWTTKEDILTFLTMYADRPQHMTEDDVYNYLFGIANVLDLRMQKLWDTYKQHFKLDEYRNRNERTEELEDDELDL